jgi:hypothetical protein
MKRKHRTVVQGKFVRIRMGIDNLPDVTHYFEEFELRANVRTAEMLELPRIETDCGVPLTDRVQGQQWENETEV